VAAVSRKQKTETKGNEVKDDADRVRIFDTTLRDGEQSPGISLNTSEKVEIALQLARLGVDVIEAGFPITSPGDFEAVQAIARRVEGPVICGLARTVFGDIDAVWNAVKDAERPRIHIVIATSDIHIERKLQTTRDDVKGQARAAVAHARAVCDDVEFSSEDASRSEVDFLAEVIQIAIDERATTINVADTVGYTMPHEFAAMFTRLYELVPDLHDVVVSVHCHDDLGLAVANSLAGIEAGCRQVECAINGIGERAGNASLEEIAMLLHTRESSLGFRTGIDTTEIARTSRLVSRLTGYEVQPNKAIVGRNAFAHEAGIHRDGACNRDVRSSRSRPSPAASPRTSTSSTSSCLTNRWQRSTPWIRAAAAGPSRMRSRWRPSAARFQRRSRRRPRPRAR
jgi:2-isopropylmalate synthase